MPVFDDPDNPALDESERQAVNQRLNTLMSDPVRQDFSEPEVVAYVDRLTDDNGVPIRSDFEPFRPAVTRSDARLESSVGDGEANHPLAVFNAKKLLNKAGFHSFKPGIEPIGEASPRFLADLKRFQFAHDLIPDAAAQPGGPTVHMLTRKVFGTGDGPPPESETEFFRERFDKDPNRTLSGQPIFGEAGLIETSATEIQEAARRGGRPRGQSGRGEKPPSGKGIKERIEDLIRKGLKSPTTRSPKRFPETEEPVIGKTPVHIFRYPDGRLYISVDKRGEFNLTKREPGAVFVENVDKNFVSGIRKDLHINYPSLDDRTSFEERHARGLESRVYGPAYNKEGRLTGFLPLRHPITKRALRIPVGEAKILTDAQIRAMGLQKWQTKPKPNS